MSESDHNSGDGQSAYQTPATASQAADGPSGPELAGRGRRFGAYMIDAIIAGIALVVVVALNLGISWADIIRDPMTQQIPIAGSIGFLVIFMAINGYFLVTKGQTLGKWMLGIRIVDAASNGAATAVKLLGLRYVLVLLVMAIPMIGQLLGLIDVLFIFRSDRRCVHDLLAGTKVVSNS
jgi:uncharacterized RDD family membrane protein YckC